VCSEGLGVRVEDLDRIVQGVIVPCECCLILRDTCERLLHGILLLRGLLRPAPPPL
jgi:hypothetical protein